jgi:N-methylhydantoinase A
MTVERGIDPRRFTLVAFGGAGPLHATDLARSLGIAEVLIPNAPGNFSALGLLAAPVREDRVRTFRSRADRLDRPALEATFGALAQDAVTSLGEDGFAPTKIRCERQVDLRYVGQAYELSVPFPGDAVTDGAWRASLALFHEAHARAYGFAKPEDPVEMINARLTAFVDLDRPRWTERAAVDTAAAPSARRAVWFSGRWLECAIVRRRTLLAGSRCEGPAIIEEHGATTVLAPGDTMTVDGWGNLRIAVGGGVSAGRGKEDR